MNHDHGIKQRYRALQVGVILLVLTLCFNGVSVSQTIGSNPVTTTKEPRTNGSLHPPRHHHHYFASSRMARQVALENRHSCIHRIRKRHYDVFASFFRDIPKNNSTILLVDPSYHDNVGDTLLTISEQSIIRQITSSPIQECNYEQAKHLGTLPHCRHWLGNDSTTDSGPRLAVWHGGGNWGDLYKKIHLPRIESMRTLLLANYSILGMPQSMYYNQPSRMDKHAARIKDNVARGLGLLYEQQDQEEQLLLTEKQHPMPTWWNASIHPMDTEEGRALGQSRVTLTWREQSSYETAQALYPFVTNVLVPDMAFQQGPFFSSSSSSFPLPSVDLLFFLRQDEESKYSAYQRDEQLLGTLLTNVSHSTNLSYQIVDWPSRYSIFGNHDHLNITTAIQMLQLGRVVICDRLHAAILAYLSGVPFVHLDQISNKVTNVFNVAFSTPTVPPKDKRSSWSSSSASHLDCTDSHRHMWARATSMEDAIAQAIQIIHDYEL